MGPEGLGRLDHAALTRTGGAAQHQIVRPNDLYGHEFCEERGPALVKMEPQGDLFPDRAVELQVFPEGGQDGPLHSVAIRVPGEGQSL